MGRPPYKSELILLDTTNQEDSIFYKGINRFSPNLNTTNEVIHRGVFIVSYSLLESPHKSLQKQFLNESYTVRLKPEGEEGSERKVNLLCHRELHLRHRKIISKNTKLLATNRIKSTLDLPLLEQRLLEYTEIEDLKKKQGKKRVSDNTRHLYNIYFSSQDSNSLFQIIEQLLLRQYSENI